MNKFKLKTIFLVIIILLIALPTFSNGFLENLCKDDIIKNSICLGVIEEIIQVDSGGWHKSPFMLLKVNGKTITIDIVYYEPIIGKTLYYTTKFGWGSSRYHIF